MNPFFPATTTWVIPDTVLPDCLSEMALDGARGNEGIVLWLGQDQGGTAQVTHLIGLCGTLIRKLPNHIHIEAELFNEVADVAFELGARLLGQIHSHGREYSLDLSPTDRIYGLQVPSYLSVVAPDYGCSLVPFSACGVHVFKPGAGYVRLSQRQVSEKLQLVRGPHLPFRVVGGEQ